MVKIICQENCKFYDKIARAAFAHLGLSGKVSVELIFSSPDEIRKINAQFRGLDKETDVLSFPSIDFSSKSNNRALDDSSVPASISAQKGTALKFNKKNYPFDYDKHFRTIMLGSILINEQMAKSQSEEYGHSLEREKSYLFLHGFLHILGYDHIEENQKSIMRNLEEEILSNLGLSIKV